MTPRETRAFNRLKLGFLVLFALGCVAVWGYTLFYAMPRDRCERRGNWWDPQHRICATPLDISTITGRPNGGPRLSQDTDAPAAAAAGNTK